MKNTSAAFNLKFHSYGDGCKLNGNRVYLQGIGDVYIRLHRPVDGIIKTISITVFNDKYYVVFSCEVLVNPFPKTNKSIGIDMGIEHFAVTSNDEFIENPKYLIRAEKRLRLLQRSKDRKKKGGNSRKKAVKLLSNCYEKVANQRKDFLHKQSAIIIKTNDIICIENLNIKGLAGGMLAKSVNDAGWGMFFNMLSYKAENADKKIIKVSPYGTSQRCSRCGTVVKKTLSVRHHYCPVCNLSIHRDLNSALEILRLGTNPTTLTWDISPCVVVEAD